MIVLEMKNLLTEWTCHWGIISRLDTTKKKISELKDIAIEITQNNAHRGKWLKNN